MVFESLSLHVCNEPGQWNRGMMDTYHLVRLPDYYSVASFEFSENKKSIPERKSE
jgi:hypothetical protein